MVGNYVEMETEGKPRDIKSQVSKLFWHGGSAYDAWFSCASNQVFGTKFICKNGFFQFLQLMFILIHDFLIQVAQVLLTLPYSFSQLGMLSGILFQLFYGLMGSWTAYLICILYLEYRTRKEREKVDFRNHVIQVKLINSCPFSINFSNLNIQFYDKNTESEHEQIQKFHIHCSQFHMGFYVFPCKLI